MFLICEIVPVSHETSTHVGLFEDGDDWLGTENTYFAISSSGSLVGWGSNHGNRLGIGLLPFYPYFARKTLGSNVRSFSCGSEAVMYVDNNHVLWRWGTNTLLLLKDDIRLLGHKVRIMEDVVEVAVGFNHVAVVETDGSLWTWGQNTEGHLGNGKIDALNGES